MQPAQTTLAIQNYLDDLANLKGDSPAEPVIRQLVGRCAERLHLLCSALLHRSYPRLTQPPLNFETGEMLSAVVERLLKAMREVRPQTVRQFFALANRHMRWELNDVARRLDERTRNVLPLDGRPEAEQAVATGTIGKADQLHTSEPLVPMLVQSPGSSSTGEAVVDKSAVMLLFPGTAANDVVSKSCERLTSGVRKRAKGLEPSTSSLEG